MGVHFLTFLSVARVPLLLLRVAILFLKLRLAKGEFLPLVKNDAPLETFVLELSADEEEEEALYASLRFFPTPPAPRDKRT